MLSRMFLVYLVVELAAVLALASTIGLGWTVLVVLGTFVVGLAVAGSQIKRQLARLRSGLRTPARNTAVSDGALVALGSVLVVVPGLVSSAVGLLLLLPPTRIVARPLVTALATRTVGRPLLTVTTFGTERRARGDYIDGEVVDVTDAEPPVLPPRAG
jgi:UPF0716 protein FxsA